MLSDDLLLTMIEGKENSLSMMINEYWTSMAMVLHILGADLPQMRQPRTGLPSQLAHIAEGLNSFKYEDTDAFFQDLLLAGFPLEKHEDCLL